jgi:hypothetical protein
MADLAQPHGTQWRSVRPQVERPTLAADPDLARKKADQRAALVVDGKSAKAEYEARRRAVHANTARLTALRLARDAIASRTQIAKGRPTTGK